MKKRLFGILICTILLFVFAGICTCAEESSEEWKIGVVVYDPENPEMESMRPWQARLLQLW